MMGSGINLNIINVVITAMMTTIKQIVLQCVYLNELKNASTNVYPLPYDVTKAHLIPTMIATTITFIIRIIIII